ncbi:nitrogenase cofactor biosynthesis protein NifB|uniref:FeMo cofactor biosynthesis protein NifB n=1 Tax=Dendrosporobacter quercicolus TaxID=146817 RepID=A0A1G9U9Y5_9FIRM|nr:nitrogenase cofactor biosynthesis protein NifB [Dendrosporobacter quercicolus]NSL49945.1 nitrogenase cofactor biosynthesis protein NifB [Dendrosporobacter quercicolus DSM 1736]SDM56642.1 nitrogen fixation protein NifB [Dendrosporobacter quercicolus]
MSCGGCTDQREVSLQTSVSEQTAKHPCYSQEAHTRYARMHLPVAPHCNISCNYCNRKFNCVNESRPGVTSEVLTPADARRKFAMVKEKVEQLSVVGIAGPGDALANWPETRESIERIKAAAPDIVFCLSTNGLMLPDFAQEIVDLGIHHVTVTVNCLDTEIGARIYKFVHYRGQKLTGVEAAATLLKNQLEGIGFLVKHGVLVKINIVMMKGINDRHIPEVVQKMKELGVFVTNIMPLIPAPGSVFEHMPQTSMKEVSDMRSACEQYLPQMRHCRQCRADAIGLLGQDRSHEFRLAPPAYEQPAARPVLKEYKIAVTTKYGRMVDQHFGHAEEFLIYQGNKNKFTLIETRKADQYCQGMENCTNREKLRDATLNVIQDCDAVLTMRIGYQAQKRLLKKGIMSIEFCDSVYNGLHYTVEQLSMLKSNVI